LTQTGPAPAFPVIPPILANSCGGTYSIQPDRTEELRKLEGIIGADEVAAMVLKRAQ